MKTEEHRYGPRNAAIWNARALQAYRTREQGRAIAYASLQRMPEENADVARNVYHQPADSDLDVIKLAPWHPHYDARKSQS